MPTLSQFMSYTCAAPKDKVADSLTIEKMQEAIDKIRGLPAANWILVSPAGLMWSGADPLVLAAQATYQSNNALYDPVQPTYDGNIVKSEYD